MITWKIRFHFGTESKNNYGLKYWVSSNLSNTHYINLSNSSICTAVSVPMSTALLFLWHRFVIPSFRIFVFKTFWYFHYSIQLFKSQYQNSPIFVPIFSQKSLRKVPKKSQKSLTVKTSARFVTRLWKITAQFVTHLLVMIEIRK